MDVCVGFSYWDISISKKIHLLGLNVRIYIIVGLCIQAVENKCKIQQISGFTGVLMLIECQSLRKIELFWNFLKKVVDNVCTWWYYIQVAAVSGNK